jgi:DNA transformation protein
MSISPQDIAYVEELFEPLGEVTHRKMMGGLSIYFEGQIFSILDSQGTIYLKAKGDFAEQMANEGARQFGEGSGRTMGYRTMPGAALDDPDAISDWARRALSHL